MSAPPTGSGCCCNCSTPARHRPESAQGFTLIELLVVIVILGVLGGVGYGAYVNQIGRANENTANVAATAAAKNCAALLATGDEDSSRPASTAPGCRSDLRLRIGHYLHGDGRRGHQRPYWAASIDANGAVTPGA